MNLEKVKSKLLLYFILGLFFVEFIGTIYIYLSDNSTVRIVGYYKLAFEIFLIAIIIHKKAPKTIVVGVAILFFTFIINQYLNPVFFDNIKYQILNGSFYFFNRYIFIFIFISAFNSVTKKKEFVDEVIKYIGYVLVFNSFFIIFGVLSGYEFFSSYPQSLTRFGSDGLFNKVNEVSYLYITYTIILYYRYIKLKSSFLFFSYIAIISLMLGTKIVVLFLILLLIFHLVIMSNNKNFYRKIVVFALFVCIFFFKSIASLIFSQSVFWSNLMDKYSIWSLVFSTRDLLIIHNYNYILENWSFINYLIGGPFYSANFTRTRMDLIDLFLHFGVLSTIVYLYLFFQNFYYKNKNTINLLAFILTLCGFLAGGLFLRISAIIYMFLAFYYLNGLQTEKKHN